MLTLTIIDFEQGLAALKAVQYCRAIKLSEDFGEIFSESSESSVSSNILGDTIVLLIDGVEVTFTKCDDCVGTWTGIVPDIAGILTATLSIKDMPEIRVACGITAEELIPKSEKLLPGIREERDSLLAATDYLMLRHSEELALNLAPTLNQEQLMELLTYRQALRDFPETVDFDNIVWPTPPSFL